MENEFIRLLKENYCVEWRCTTCGCMPFRSAVKKLGNRFFESMMELDEEAVMEYDKILEYVNIGIYCIPDQSQREQLAAHWPTIFRLISEGTRQPLLMVLWRGTFNEFNA